MRESRLFFRKLSIRLPEHIHKAIKKRLIDIDQNFQDWVVAKVKEELGSDHGKAEKEGA